MFKSEVIRLAEPKTDFKRDSIDAASGPSFLNHWSSDSLRRESVIRN